MAAAFGFGLSRLEPIPEDGCPGGNVDLSATDSRMDTDILRVLAVTGISAHLMAGIFTVFYRRVFGRRFRSYGVRPPDVAGLGIAVAGCLLTLFREPAF